MEHTSLMNVHDRRRFLIRGTSGAGAMALWSLLGQESHAEASTGGQHLPATAKNIIFLNMSGGPSQLDLFDPKPELTRLTGKTISSEHIHGEKFAQLSGPLELLASPYRFARHGQSGAEFSQLLPQLAKISDQLTIVRSMTTDSVNHDPAQMMLSTGWTQPGRPSMGAWTSYGLGSECDNLPAFVVMLSGTGQPLGAHSWGSGFLPTTYQGVKFRGQGAPVLNLRDPEWMTRTTRRRSLDTLRSLNQLELDASGDPEIATRIASYEMAYRMQTSVPELMNLGHETSDTYQQYGVQPGETSFGANCLLARRLVERGVRFVQLYHRGWDHHGLADTGGIDRDLPQRCREVDQATAALITDLKHRGLLDSTLVVWGGEFGRTPIRQQSKKTDRLGRDHHRRAFTMLMAGGGMKPGITHGATDDLGFHVAENPVHVHDLQATLLHCLGIDHTRLTYRHQGRDYRLTDVGGKVVKGLLS